MKKNMVSDNFTKNDFTCNCGCGTFIPAPSLVRTIQILRNWFCMPIIVHCTVRCHKHNVAIGGVDESRHLPKYFEKDEGAIDFHVRGMSIRKLHQELKQLWKDKCILKGGLGLYSWGAHIDTSSYRRWGEYWTIERQDKVKKLLGRK